MLLTNIPAQPLTELITALYKHSPLPGGRILSHRADNLMDDLKVERFFKREAG